MPPAEPTPTDVNPDYPGGTPPSSETNLPGVPVESQATEPQPDASLDYGGPIGEPPVASDPSEALASLPPVGDELSGSADYVTTTTTEPTTTTTTTEAGWPEETTTTTTTDSLTATTTTTTVPEEPTTTTLPEVSAPTASPSQPPFSMPTE